MSTTRVPYKRIFSFKTLFYCGGKRQFDKYKTIALDVAMSVTIVVMLLSLVVFQAATK